MSGLMRFQETCALCTALNSFAAWEDFTESLIKQDKNVVNDATFHTFQPFPSTFLLPKYRINSTPVIEMIRYSGGNAVLQIFARTADFS